MQKRRKLELLLLNQKVEKVKWCTQVRQIPSPTRLCWLCVIGISTATSVGTKCTRLKSSMALHTPAHDHPLLHPTWVLLYLVFQLQSCLGGSPDYTQTRYRQAQTMHSAQWHNNLPFQSLSQEVLWLLGCISSTYVSRREGKMEPAQNQTLGNTGMFSWLFTCIHHNKTHMDTYPQFPFPPSPRNTPPSKLRKFYPNLSCHLLPRSSFHRQKFKTKIHCIPSYPAVRNKSQEAARGLEAKPAMCSSGAADITRQH